jgi:hypothetical protein
VSPYSRSIRRCSGRPKLGHRGGRWVGGDSPQIGHEGSGRAASASARARRHSSTSSGVRITYTAGPRPREPPPCGSKIPAATRAARWRFTVRQFWPVSPTKRPWVAHNRRRPRVMVRITRSVFRTGGGHRRYSSACWGWVSRSSTPSGTILADRSGSRFSSPSWGMLSASTGASSNRKCLRPLSRHGERAPFCIAGLRPGVADPLSLPAGQGGGGHRPGAVGAVGGQPIGHPPPKPVDHGPTSTRVALSQRLSTPPAAAPPPLAYVHERIRSISARSDGRHT